MPDVPTGRSRVGLFRLVPALTLLLGALGLFHAEPAQAQATPIWSATLTVKDTIDGAGCDNSDGAAFACSTNSVLTDDEFTLGGTTYEMYHILGTGATGDEFSVFFNQVDVQTALDSYSFYIGSTEFPFSSADHTGGAASAKWLHSTGWNEGDVISLSIAPGTGLPLSSLSLISAGIGPFVHLPDLEPGFEPRVTNYTSAVPFSHTQVKVRARVDATSYTLTVGKRGATAATLTSGAASAAIALRLGANVIEVKSASAAGAPVRTTTITITRHVEDAPGAPRNLTVTAGARAGELEVAWTASLSNPLGYDVHYTSATRIEVPDGAAATGNDPAAAWVVVNRSGKATTQTITGLVGGTTYRVRVRAENANGKGFWEEARGTPNAAAVSVPTVRLSAWPNPVPEGRTVTVTATLSGALSSSVTIPVSISDNSAEPEDHGTLTSITIGSGATSGTGTITTNQDADDVDETFMVALGALPSDVTAGSPSSVQIRIMDDDSGDNKLDPPPPEDPPPEDPPPEDPPPPPPGDSGPGDDDPDDPGGSGPGDDDSDDSGDDGQSDDDPVNRATELKATMLRAGAAVAIDLSDTFDNLDGEAPEYTVESSDESVATVEVDGGMLTVHGIVRGSAKITTLADYGNGESVSQTFIVTVTGPAMIWYLPSVSNTMAQGFVRVVNHSDTTGVATLTATDDAGRTYDPVTLKLEPRHAVSVNADDLETGNSDNELTGATGMGMGNWRLSIDSETLDVEALAYAHAEDGFISGMNAVATLTDGSVEIPFFNPGSNIDQVSLLRLVNPADEEAKATVTGVDDNGASPGASVQLTLAAGVACTMDAEQLESGEGLLCGESQDGLGDGHGHWRLTVKSSAPLVAMNLLSDADGHLTNLSATASPDGDDMWHVHLFPVANNEHARQGVVRIINRSSAEGNVSIAASDDSDMAYEALSLSIGGNKAAHLDSDDLELGNEDKDLTGATGSGMGAWRLALSSDTIDINANAYVRTSDGLLTAMNTTAPQARDVSRVAFFNSGDDDSMSVLRLVNASTDDTTVAIDGTDDIGLRPGTTVRVMVPATDAVELTAAQLESGEADAITSGALGDGTGRWRLRVDGAVTVLSLLSNPSGHLTNLSHAENSRLLRSLPTALLPPSTTVALENVGDRLLRARWSAVEGARYDVDVLKDGVREDIRSLKNTRSTAIRWWYRSPAGTYTIRVRSVNADGVRGPWSALSNEITFD